MATHLFKLAKAVTSNMDSIGGPHVFFRVPQYHTMPAWKG